CLDRDYYEPAVAEVRKHLSDPKFYIFSEDADYVNEAFSWLPEKTVVDINSGADSFRDMQLMTKCKANIIANSTFSQWASILNENPEHITVYPSVYMSGEDTEERTLPGWIRI
ncbi:MAG: alpha-1,2-fucosyltransferase, partial [Lachnospiraceae bacterium]|nr:alpha-1,2-fucosyltransferase [Lachnospiraceae bacterium]